MNKKMMEKAQNLAEIAEEIRQDLASQTEPEAIETLERRYEEAYVIAHDAILAAAEAEEGDEEDA